MRDFHLDAAWNHLSCLWHNMSYTSWNNTYFGGKTILILTTSFDNIFNASEYHIEKCTFINATRYCNGVWFPSLSCELFSTALFWSFKFNFNMFCLKKEELHIQCFQSFDICNLICNLVNYVLKHSDHIKGVRWLTTRVWSGQSHTQTARSESIYR